MTALKTYAALNATGHVRVTVPKCCRASLQARDIAP